MKDQRPYTTTYHTGWESKIRNIESLPAGTGARFLRCMIAHTGDLIATSWHRKEPKGEHGYMVFTFPR